MLPVGYFEGIESERGLEWRCADSQGAGNTMPGRWGGRRGKGRGGKGRGRVRTRNPPAESAVPCALELPWGHRVGARVIQAEATVNATAGACTGPAASQALAKALRPLRCLGLGPRPRFPALRQHRLPFGFPALLQLLPRRDRHDGGETCE